MHCLMSLSSRRWFCALLGSVRGRISELMLTKGARISRSPNKPKVPQAVALGLCFGLVAHQKQSVVLNSQAFIETTEYISARVSGKFAV